VQESDKPFRNTLDCGPLGRIACRSGHDDSAAVPRGVLLPGGVVRAEEVPVRVQVSGGVGGQDGVQAALLLPGGGGDEPDAVPDRVRVPGPGDVRAEPVSAGDVGDVRGEGAVRQLPAGAVLPQRDDDDAVPGGVLLPDRHGEPGPVPGGTLLQYWFECLEAVPVRVLLPGGGFRRRRCARAAITARRWRRHRRRARGDTCARTRHARRRSAPAGTSVRWGRR